MDDKALSLPPHFQDEPEVLEERENVELNEEQE